MNDNKVVADDSLRKYLHLESIPRGVPLWLPVYRKIYDLIVNGHFVPGTKLPPEAELADLCGVGRMTLRTAIAILQEDGYVKTLHGKGTYVTYEPQKELVTYPDKSILPRRRLESLGKKVTVLRTHSQETGYDEYLDDKLNACGKTVNVFERLYSIDGSEGAINYCAFYICDLLQGINIHDNEAVEAALEELFNDKVDHVDCTFLPADKLVVPGSPKKKNSECILVSSTWIGYDGKPLVHCKDYYYANVIRFRARFNK